MKRSTTFFLAAALAFIREDSCRAATPAIPLLRHVPQQTLAQCLCANEEELFEVKPFSKNSPAILALYAKYPNGINSNNSIDGGAIDSKGNIYFINHADRERLSRMRPDGIAEIVLELPRGSYCTSVCLDRSGRIYFADRPQHRIRRYELETEKLEVFASHDQLREPYGLAIAPNDTIYVTAPDFKKRTGTIWRIGLDGNVTRQALSGTAKGIEISPDGKCLYVCEPAQHSLWVYTIADDGSLIHKRLVKDFSVKQLTGLRCDADGNVYVSATDSRTAWKVSPNGTVLREINVLGEGASNLCFGGPDGRTAYSTQGPCILQFRVDRPGAAWQSWHP